MRYDIIIIIIIRPFAKILLLRRARIVFDGGKKRRRIDVRREHMRFYPVREKSLTERRRFLAGPHARSQYCYGT